MTAQPGKNSAETDEAAKDTGSNGKVTDGSTSGGGVTTSLKKAEDAKAGDGNGSTAGAKPAAKSGLKSTAGSSDDAAETKVDTPTLPDSSSRSKPVDGVKPAGGTIASSASSFSSTAPGSTSSAFAASPTAASDTGGSGSRPVVPAPAASSPMAAPAISTPYGPGPAGTGSGASTASTASMGSTASSASGGSAAGKAAASPRKAHLQLARLEPWSVMKFSFVMSLVCFVVLLVAVVVLWVVLSGLGVFDAISTTVNDLTREQGDKTGGLDAGSWFSFARVFGYTVLVGAVNVLLITALSTIGSVMYNMAADLVGGVEVTLKEVE